VVVTTNAIVRANPSRLVAADVSLAVEVMSGGSRRTDRVTKLSEYAEAGIADYWIVDLEDPVSLAHHRLGSNHTYQHVGTYQRQADVTYSGDTMHLDLDSLTSP